MWWAGQRWLWSCSPIFPFSLFTPLPSAAPPTGQIWVGKEADSGAQIAVKDVRGDSVLWLDEQALTATAFIKDGKKRPCSFQTLHHVRKQSPTLRGLSLSGWD